jgi:putative endonuclease
MGSRAGTLYTGMTGFLDCRIGEHKQGLIEVFTKKYSCDRFVYYETFDDVWKAIGSERQLKSWRRDKKIALIEKMTRDGKPSPSIGGVK